jgi:hypothetical protein
LTKKNTSLLYFWLSVEWLFEVEREQRNEKCKLSFYRCSKHITNNNQRNYRKPSKFFLHKQLNFFAIVENTKTKHTNAFFAKWWEMFFCFRSNLFRIFFPFKREEPESIKTKCSKNIFKYKVEIFDDFLNLSKMAPRGGMSFIVGERIGILS